MNKLIADLMKTKSLFVLLFAIWNAFSLQAQKTDGHYIEVTGTSEIEVVPDEIHYIIEIKEYFKEEFDGKSKPEDYRTKVPLTQIEQDLKTALYHIGITDDAIRTREVGDYRRERGHDFLIAKNFDLTLTNFNQINEIVKAVDTKGINSMHIGELKNQNMQHYHKKGKLKALQAAQIKATYLVESLGKKLGSVIRIVEPQQDNIYSAFPQSNVYFSTAKPSDSFRTIKLNYSMQVRFEIE